MQSEPTTLREIKKVETKHTILVEARRLFALKGFDATTLDEICEASHISRRTFFRYFPTKEALFFPNREAHLRRFRALLAARSTDEPMLATLQRASRAFAAAYAEHREQIIASQELLNSSAALLAREREIDHEWEEVLEQAYRTEAEDSPEGRRWARVVAGATMGVIRATMRHWFDEGGREDLEALGKEALDHLHRGFWPR